MIASSIEKQKANDLLRYLDKKYPNKKEDIKNLKEVILDMEDNIFTFNTSMWLIEKLRTYKI